MYNMSTQLSVFLYQTRRAAFFDPEETMKKRIFYTEAAYLLGIALLALGMALMERGGFGISIVVAPAYVLHLATSLSFGVAEYILQGAILLLYGDDQIALGTRMLDRKGRQFGLFVSDGSASFRQIRLWE